MDRDARYATVARLIREKGSMLVAFSGGVDSSLLAVIAHQILGTKSRCILLDSPVVPREAIEDAKKIARGYGIRLEVIPASIMEDTRFTRNPADRCYFCKKDSAAVLKEKARDLGFACVADGINVSDTGEHRPGLAASTEEGIFHPFLEAGITKSEIREIAKDLGCLFWDKPSAACLASRIPYGDVITRQKLAMAEKAEEFLHKNGLLQVRVRIHGNIARIEVPKDELSTVLCMSDAVTRALSDLGFSYITLDLAGYRSGSMDEVLGPGPAKEDPAQ
jgi:uncharacterized protein